MKIFSSIFTSLLVLCMITIAGVMACSYFQKNIANENGNGSSTETIAPIEKPDIKPDNPSEGETNKPDLPTGGAGETTPDIKPEEKPDTPDDSDSVMNPEEKPTTPDNDATNKPSIPENGNSGNGNTANAPSDDGNKGENNNNTALEQPDTNDTNRK